MATSLDAFPEALTAIQEYSPPSEGTTSSITNTPSEMWICPEVVSWGAQTYKYVSSCTGDQFEILIWDPFPTSVRPLCLLIQCRSGWGWPETLQDTDTRSPTNTFCCSADTNTSGASEMTHHITTTSPTFTGTSHQTVNTWTDQTRGALWWHFSQLSCSWRCRHIPRSLTWSQHLWSAGCAPS